MTPSAPWEHTLDPEFTSRGRVPFRHYLVWFFLLTAFMYVASFFLIRSNAYLNWRESQWGPMLEFSYAPGAGSADVLIFGDSSAFIGIDPRIIQRQLSVSALLMPNTIGSLPITQDISLRRYLKSHKRPKLLVLYFSPWNLDYNQAIKVPFFEGDEMILRHGTGQEIAGFMLHHPTEFLFFPFRFFNTYGAGMLKSWLPHHGSAKATVHSALGHVDDFDPVPPLASKCQIPTHLLNEKSEASVSELAARYSKELPVLVYMAPIPGCTNAPAALQRSFSAVAAAPPVVLPPNDFVADPFYAHIKPFAVPAATQLLTQAIRVRLAQPQNAMVR